MQDQATQTLKMRWMIRRDLNEIAVIESMQVDPWSYDDLLEPLRQRNGIGQVFEHEQFGRIVGYVLYELHKNRLEFTRFVVAPDTMRQGVGRWMMNKLKGKLRYEQRMLIAANVPDWNLSALLFFKAMGFRCDTTVGSSYRMVFRMSQPD